MFMNQSNHRTTCNNPGALWRNKQRDSRQRCLYHTLTTGKWQKLLGEIGRAQRPQPRPASASQNYRVEMFHRACKPTSHQICFLRTAHHTTLCQVSPCRMILGLYKGLRVVSNVDQSLLHYSSFHRNFLLYE